MRKSLETVWELCRRPDNEMFTRESFFSGQLFSTLPRDYLAKRRIVDYSHHTFALFLAMQ